MEKAALPDLHEARGQDVLQEAAETRHDAEVGGAGGERSRDSGAKAMQTARRVVMAGARA